MIYILKLNADKQCLNKSKRGHGDKLSKGIDMNSKLHHTHRQRMSIPVEVTTSLLLLEMFNAH